ncbi:MAG: flippase-like domain-containing protein [Deltaproteobacteria bacterium]|nr:flippase-like domain-containing protein [Deltaproteobacteria bacterium]
MKEPAINTSHDSTPETASASPPAAASPSSGRLKWLKTGIGFAVSFIFLYYVLRGVDFRRILSAMTGMNPVYVLLGLVSLALDYTLRIIRWWVMLHVFNQDIRCRDCITPYMAGIAVNNVVPLRAGDVLRVFGFQTQLKTRYPVILSTLLLERLLDLFTLLIIFFGFFLVMPVGRASVPFYDSIILLVAIAISGVCCVIFLSRPIRNLLSHPAIRRRVDRVSVLHKAHDAVIRILDSLVTLSRFSLLLPLLVYSVGAWLLEGGLFIAVAAALGLPGCFNVGMFALSMGTLSTLVPSSPGYFGTFHFFTMQAAQLFQIAPEQAASYAFATHFLLWGTMTLAGFIFYCGYLYRKNRRA